MWTHSPRRLWSLLLVASSLGACAGGERKATPAVGMQAQGTSVDDVAPVAPVTFPRISVIGASMSAGFGGTSFASAFAAASPSSTVEDLASILLFQDPAQRGDAQVTESLASKPSLVVAIDFLFWYAYNAPGQRLAYIEQGLASLDKLVASGAQLVVGDVPRIVTAPLLIPISAVPSVDEMTQINTRIHEWGAAQTNVVVVPFAEWAEPLAAGEKIEVTPGEWLPATELVNSDGLHPNALGVWNVLHRVDQALETQLGSPAQGLVFVRPTAEAQPVVGSP